MADLEMRKISKQYGGVVALDKVDFQCYFGEVNGLVGENGAGKSTLVKILSAVVSRDSGDIFLEGKTLELHNPKQAINSGIGIVFQELSLLPDLTVSENIFFGSWPTLNMGYTSRSLLRQRCYELFDKMGIEVANPDQPVRELPLAKRQMVEIAKVLSREPRVVIFDEATSALGREQTEWLLDYCGRLSKQGKIVIFISHRLSEVRQVSDRITVFRNGQFIRALKRNEATTDEIVSLIIGRELNQLYPKRDTQFSHDIVLEVRNLRVGTRLQGINFSLRKGEILGIGGLTGQGQRELFHSLFGIEPSQGEIFLNNKQLNIANPSDALKHGLALVPEDRATQGLLLTKSVLYNITLSILSHLERFGLVQKSRELGFVKNAIEKLNIKVSDVNIPVQQLSGGNQQKVVLAKLTGRSPKILMLFDSTRGVDVGTKSEIFQLLREITKNNASVLLYSTTSDELVNMCDRILVMREGKIQSELTSGNITSENLIRASLGETINSL